MRDALSFSLNIPAVKAGTVIGNDAIQTAGRGDGDPVPERARRRGRWRSPWGSRWSTRCDLVRAYGTLGDRGRLVEQTTILTVTDNTGTVVIEESQRPKPADALDPGAAYITTDILAGNTNPRKNPFWGQFAINDGGVRRPATLKTGTSNEARDLNAYGFIAAPDDRGAQGRRVRAGRRRVERQLGQLAGQRPRRTAVLDRRHHVRVAGLHGGGHQGLEDQRLQGAQQPRARVRRPVDGARVVEPQRGRRAVPRRAPRPRASCPRRRAAARRS